MLSSQFSVFDIWWWSERLPVYSRYSCFFATPAIRIITRVIRGIANVALGRSKHHRHRHNQHHHRHHHHYHHHRHYHYISSPSQRSISILSLSRLFLNLILLFLFLILAPLPPPPPSLTYGGLLSQKSTRTMPIGFSCGIGQTNLDCEAVFPENM